MFFGIKMRKRHLIVLKKRRCIEEEVIGILLFGYNRFFCCISDPLSRRAQIFMIFTIVDNLGKDKTTQPFVQQKF
jgi:hypothetical protein